MSNCCGSRESLNLIQGLLNGLYFTKIEDFMYPVTLQDPILGWCSFWHAGYRYRQETPCLFYFHSVKFHCHMLYALLKKCEVKMAGYWLSSFFACSWTETEPRSVNSQKKERGQYPAILIAHLVSKGFIIWLSGKFFLRDAAASPEKGQEAPSCPLA